ncbi:rcc01693 family protein [Aureimonas leprariae]|uniref:Phage tail assembly chaperone n=1 Tax=Plantimonas leprariae TaxID=2615207 RepID=A0A7V7TWT7_9HYPH|nr:rcc01693 family protein [Aureimonas leprariae]KAB0679945.1 phage tail assembly chaperone [Aureimonas leprariae]
MASRAGDAFPWDEAMAAGFGLLRLTPDAFWRLSPREFAQAIRPFVRDGRDAPSRAALDRLLQRFPDAR